MGLVVPTAMLICERKMSHVLKMSRYLVISQKIVRYLVLIGLKKIDHIKTSFLNDSGVVSISLPKITHPCSINTFLTFSPLKINSLKLP